MAAVKRTSHLPPIISGTSKATDLTFGRSIHRVHPNKSPLKILEKRKRGRWTYRWTSQLFLGTPVLSQQRVKLRTSNFVHIFTASIGRKTH